MDYIITTHNLSKAFKGKEVVSNVNMHIQKGEVYGFLGPNGAGKTTILKMILNLLKPTVGTINVFNNELRHDSYDYLARIGSIIEYPVFYTDLSAKENLEIHCEYMGYYKKGAIEEALRLVSLTGTEDKSVKEFSLGMKQRLGIARAIISKPELLILDEPINGLDPVGIKEIRQLLKMLSRDFGITILISSHIISEIEQIADTIGVIDQGILVEEISMDELRNEQADFIEIHVDNPDKACFILDNELHLKNIKVFKDQSIRIYDEIEDVGTISKVLVNRSVSIEGIRKSKSSLEDYFLSLVEGGDLSA